MNLKSPDQIGRLAAATLLGATFLSQAFAASTTVSVNFGSTKSAMSSQGLGVASAVYDGYLTSSGVGSALANAGVKAVRYPGGSYADIFHWQNYTSCGGYLASGNGFDNFMSTVVNGAGAKALITANYGSDTTCTHGGDPSEAAGWVNYANKTKGYGITYWEIGNETGGNGYFGDPGWEYDLHYPYNGNRTGQPALSPNSVGSNTVQFIQQMKAQDSSIKCGIGYDNSNDSALWNGTSGGVKCGSLLDFVYIHWYPGGAAAALLQTSSQIASTISTAQSQMSSLLGRQLQIIVSEAGPGTVTGTPAALWAADMYATWLENGAQNVDFQELHSGFLTTANAFDAGAYGCKMVSYLASSGEPYVTTSSGTTMVSAHAVKKSNGSYSVLLVNKDPSNAYSVTVNVSGATLASTGTTYTYTGSAINTGSISGVGSSSFTINVPAYQMIVVNIGAGSGGGSVAAGTYSIKCRTGGLVIDNYGSTANGATVYQYTDGTSNNQKYTLNYDSNGYAKLMCVTGSEYLDSNNATTNGAVCAQWASSSSQNQEWSLVSAGSGYYYIVNRANGKYLDNYGATTNGSPIRFYSSSGSYNQQWSFITP